MKEYLSLIKPGIILGNLIAALGGFFVAAKGQINLKLFLAMILGLSCVIGSACVFNNIHDRFMDEKMTRTKKRPLVTKALSLNQAFSVAFILLSVGIVVLWRGTNLLTLGFSLLGFIVYVLIYTPLKPRTYHGTIIGAIAGATPPVVGYVAVTNHFDVMALVLFLIFALWQMPHFFAIAIYRMPEYVEAKIPVHPAVFGVESTKKQMIFYTAAFSIVVLMPFFIGKTNITYLVILALLSVYWLILAFKGLKEIKEEKWAKKMFGMSLLLVMAMSILLTLDYRV